MIKHLEETNSLISKTHRKEQSLTHVMMIIQRELYDTVKIHENP